MKFIVCKVMGFLLFIFIDDDDDWTVSVFKNMIIVSVFYDFFTGSKKIDVEMYFDDDWTVSIF